jgi:uncharacterized protein YggE
MRTITVLGIGKVNVKPDTIEVSLDIITLNRDYKAMMEEAEKKLSILTYQLSNIGFKKDDIKTRSFTVTAKYENVREPDGTYTSEFVGYEARQTLRLRFPLDTKLLGETLGAISRSIAKPEIRIRFTFNDETEAIRELLERAVADAMDKAKILADSGGVTLGKIQTIDSVHQEYPLYSETEAAPQIVSMGKADIVPEDIELSDTVNIVYEISE